MRRRELLANGAATSLVLAFRLPLGRAADDAPPFVPNAFLRISPDESVTVLIHKSEMGQGVMTSLPQLLAEELGADWTRIKVEHGLPVKAYVMKGDFGQQFTGGSTSVRKSWTLLLEAGAAAREMLVGAAALAMGVPPQSCQVENGFVIAEGHPPVSFGSIAAAAARLPVPRHVKLKDPKEYHLVGRELPRLDVPSKVDGSAVFGIDVQLPGCLTAVVLRPPTFGGRVARFEAGKALAVPGVKEVLPISTGLAVVAEGFWPAVKGRKLLEVTWEMGDNAAVSSATVSAGMESALAARGRHVRSRGSVKKAMGQAAKKLEAAYELPYLAHAPMEPLNAVAHVNGKSCEIWSGTQVQTGSRRIAAKITGIPEDEIQLHTTLLGGGFGRRGQTDFVQEAVEVSHALQKPVKLIFTREDDIQHGFYRPANRHHLSAGLDAAGNALAWAHKIAVPSIILDQHYAPEILSLVMNDPSSVDGSEIPYSVPNLDVRWVRTHSPAPIGFWRSVGNSFNGFVTESFMDEIAAAAGADPLEFRLKLLDKAPRHKAVLALAAEKAGWGKSLPEGHHLGLAVCESFGSYVAEVAEISVGEEGTPAVHKVTCAVDCGRLVNPAIIKAQLMSGVVYGLTAALYGAITLEKGAVQQHGFNDYPLMRMREAPQVETYIVESREPPGGVGEVGVPPAAPALCNAIFAATGVRIRQLPVETALLARAPAAQP